VPTVEAKDRTFSRRIRSSGIVFAPGGPARRAPSNSRVSGVLINRLAAASPSPEVPPVITMVVITEKDSLEAELRDLEAKLAETTQKRVVQDAIAALSESIAGG
jgi:hypothetical protein